ncbi:MAG: FtsX-like permease family protein, partial [Bacilli bacterium]|nr:FtsX-like permease family protein [Bacilli bacterium]
MKVVGVVDSDNLVMYGEPYWNIDFWRDNLGMNSFLLEPSRGVYHLHNPKDVEKASKYFANKYRGYRFLDPTSEITSSVNEVVSYVSIVLNISTYFTLAISLFLLLTVALLIANENKRQGTLLYKLGFDRKEITESYFSHILIIIVYSLTISLFSLFFLEYAFDKTIKLNFSSNNHFSVDVFPLIICVILCLFCLVIAYFFLSRWVSNRKIINEN